jgi:hypothetical protein
MKRTELEYDIVKFEPCPYYGRLKEFLADGWEHNGDFVHKNSHSIDINFFSKPELCCTISVLKVDHKEPDVDMRTIGSRLTDLNDDEWLDFIQVYRIANHKISNEHFKK